MKFQGRISALLGPTNTGKTFVAIERMLSHTSGMIGFPLRLLARENYDKVAAIKGRAQVALVTGEEHIIPENPRYFICTVEAMPLDRKVEFVCIDEIQMAADPDRGHIFTDRIFNARGLSETMFIGSDTIGHLLKRLIPAIDIQTRERFSKLAYAGYKKIIRLPQRSAIVAFSAADVYALAEFMRRQKGGTAVVMGALSPRARNAQVGMYQSGEVDYIVATDAIGMGLNMDIDHVAFSTITKFDGRNKRNLRPAEMAQIAGRAGRYKHDGTFGTTADEGSLADHLVKKIESHKFDPLHFIYWRNSDLSFDSIDDLKHTLNAPAPRDFCKRPSGLEDQAILEVMADDLGTRHLANGYDAVKMLWDICQVPDYRRLLTEVHARFLMQIYQHLMTAGGQIPVDWIEKQIAGLDRYDGDMNAIMTRLAHIRMWTYISNRGHWINDAAAWQERTRAIEDRLSDALHAELTQRFVDKRVSVLMKKLDENAEFTAEVAPSGDVLVEGQYVGKLSGFRFYADQEVLQTVSKPIKAAAHKAVVASLPKQIDLLLACDVQSLTLARNDEILWHGKPVARLQTGKTVLAPHLQVLAEDAIDADGRAKIAEFLGRWLAGYLQTHLGDLYRLRDISGGASLRGLVFQLEENLGCVEYSSAAALIDGLDPKDRAVLEQAGFIIGVYAVYAKNLYAPRQTILRAQLWGLSKMKANPAATLAGKLSLQTEQKITREESLAAGYIKVDRIYIRADKFERLGALFADCAKRHKPVKADHWKSALPVNAHQAWQIADAMGFIAKKLDQSLILNGRKKHPAKKAEKPRNKDPNSPFAVLGE